MVNPHQQVIKITELEQVCIVVHDVDKTAQAMWNTFGIGPWNVLTKHSSDMSEMTYHGKPARFSFKGALTQNKLGGIGLALIAPLEGDNIYRDFLREYGEGVQHLGHHKVASLEALAETNHKLEQAGFPCAMSGRTVVGCFAYIDTRSVLKTFLKLTWADPSIISLPPPAHVFSKEN
jgi:methylmalonyl-CoA/ethylmalonyl-CoA epimerase